MGNPLLKNFNIDKDPFLTGGFNNLWKIYKGSRKDRKQDVCVFVLEKKDLEKYSKDREEIMNLVKKESGALVKFKHPGILSIYETLVEDKSSFVYVTEPVQYTLSSWIEGTGASKLEIKLMITELCNVISFLHDDAHVIHSAINPDEVFITQQGHIKLSGLSFSVSDPSINGTELKLNSIFPNAMPPLRYVAPEIVCEGKAFYQSDIFSLGMVIHNMLKFHKGGSDKDLLKLNGSNTVEAYKRAYDDMDSKLMRLAFENDDNDLIFKSLNKLPLQRPTIKEFLDHSWFNDPKLKALRFIENLEQNESQKNAEFLSKFPNILHIFENKIIERRFIPCFMSALKIETLIVNILPAIFCICESPNIKIDFEQIIWPGLKTLFQMKQMPAAALYFLLSKLNYIADKISNSEFSTNMLNIICKALDCGVAKIQSVVLDNLLFIIKKVDSLAFKNQIYPRLVNILTNTTSPTLKINILKSFTSVYSLLDQNIINESLLNTLEKVRKADNNPEICMCVVSIYEEIAKVVSVESIANKILPNLISILVSGNISRKNFENIMSLVQKYLTRIKESREKDLVDDTNKLEAKDTINLMNPNSTSGVNSKLPGEKDDFSFLDSFFGGGSSSSNKVSSVVTSNRDTTNNTTSTNTLDFEYIDKPNLQSMGMDNMNKKEKTIFDGIKDNVIPAQSNSNNTVSQFNSSGNTAINKTNEKFNYVINNNAPNTSSNNLSSSMNFNNFVNKKQDNIKNYFPNVDFSNTNTKNNPRDLNMLDSLLSDLPGGNKTNSIPNVAGNTGYTGNINIKNNSSNYNPNNNFNFTGNNTPNTNTNTFQNNQNNQNNFNLNSFDLTYDIKKTSPINTGMNNLNLNNLNMNTNSNDDYYSLDFLKNSNNTNKQQPVGNQMNPNVNFNFDLTKPNQQQNMNIPNNSNINLSGFNFTNTNNKNDANKNILDGLLKF